MPRIQTQTVVLGRLERETRKALRKAEDEAIANLLQAWKDTEDRIAGAIGREYRADFPAGTWNLAEATARGTLARMRHAAALHLNAFARDGSAIIHRAITDAYWQEVGRQVWMLDALTPPSYHPVIPARQTREAMGPRDYKASWPEAFIAWVQTFDAQLATNLRMEALHEGSLEDAELEAGSARIDGFVMPDKLKSLVTTQSLIAMDDARDDVVDANPSIVMDEIWQTMEDAAVCPICAPYDGQKLEDVDDEIPAHFNCRCYSRLVPRSWAEMLRSGDPAEKEAALKMDDAGMVDDAMAIRGDDGDLIATAVVKFEDWVSGRAAEFYGQNIAGRFGAGRAP